MAIKTGPIQLVHDMHKWLETKGWILATKLYDHMKLVNTLVMAALASKLDELKCTALAMAFLLDANITDHVSGALVDTVVAKAFRHIETLVNKLSTTGDFLAAYNAKQAEATLTLKVTTEILGRVLASLGALASKLASTSPAPSTAPTWALIAKASAMLPTMTNTAKPVATNMLSGDDLMWVQPQVLHNACTILVQFNSRDDMVPKDLSMTSTSKLHDKLNKLLVCLNEKVSMLVEAKDGEVESIMPKTHTVGMKLVSGSAYLIEFNTTDSATGFHHHIAKDWISFTMFFGDNIEVIIKAFHVIA
ncbi:hypothetical protein C0989_004596, partial [Termitomyces sp. Mn162]